MRRFRTQMIGALGFVILLLGSLLHVPQWVTHAAAIYSPPVSRAPDAGRIPYQSWSTDPVLSSSRGSGGVNNATFTFAAPPAGYRLVVENISTVLPATQANVGVGAYLYAAAEGVESSRSAKYFNTGVGCGSVAAGGITTTPMAILTGYLEAVQS